MYMTQNSTDQNQIFKKLKMKRLKNEKGELNNEMVIDRNDLNNVEISMNQLAKQIDEKLNTVKEKQKKLMELEKAINETQKSYEIIVETTQKLSNALQTQSSHLRSAARKH